MNQNSYNELGGEFNKNKQYKLWIDETSKSSYCNDTDQMFEEGNCATGHLNVFKK